MRAWVLDLDGVVWRGDEPVPGSADAIRRLRERGDDVVFLTNNSFFQASDYVEKLTRHGIDASPSDVITSAQAAASVLQPGQRALVCGGPGIVDALAVRGVEATSPPFDGKPVDAVIVGWHRDFDYARLTAAMHAVKAGGRLIGTNDDATFPVPEGELPGGGAILAAVATASGATPDIAGKPHEPMARLVEARVDVRNATVVGDRPSTDGLMAHNVGMRFALVLSGVTSRDALPCEPTPDAVADDLASLVADA